MKLFSMSVLVITTGLITSPALAEEQRKSGFGFGMGSGTPERHGNRYGWGFGSVDDDPDDGIEQSSMNGGVGWRDNYDRGRPSNRWSRGGSGFGFGSNRHRYAPPPPWAVNPGYGAYPPPYDPRWQTFPQPNPAQQQIQSGQ